jgi:hypothetical protein
MKIGGNIKISTQKGMLYATKMKRDEEYTCVIGTANIVKIPVSDVHL